ncbi:unnamed protein product [Cuscuta europaea]|uniref:Uncharacterized protein n=1 Tax=Cuscuta europaea TaxID=41803 RepID=A0A9P0YMR1_CUSEU|nr:unnamed protein product [Cuscuta europaea]
MATGNVSSGALLQVDIEHTNSCDKSMELIFVEDTREQNYGLDSPKDFFQNIMTNGVNSLSLFLIKEFEKTLVSILGKRDDLKTSSNDERGGTDAQWL